MKLFIILFSIIFLSGCSDSETAEKALTESGYTKINITGYEIFGCDKNDTFSTGFIAVSQSGHKVNGVVCSGFLKGATIRLL